MSRIGTGLCACNQPVGITLLTDDEHHCNVGVRRNHSARSKKRPNISMDLQLWLLDIQIIVSHIPDKFCFDTAKTSLKK